MESDLQRCAANGGQAAAVTWVPGATSKRSAIVCICHPHQLQWRSETGISCDTLGLKCEAL